MTREVRQRSPIHHAKRLTIRFNEERESIAWIEDVRDALITGHDDFAVDTALIHRPRIQRDHVAQHLEAGPHVRVAPRCSLGHRAIRPDHIEVRRMSLELTHR
jgi:hypothetical protein